MVSITTLWLPILLSAVFVFIASSVIYMVIGYHNKDFKKVPDEDKLMDALRGFNLPPGEYAVPYAGSNKELSSPEYNEKVNKGPVLIMNVWKTGNQGMGRQFVQWFLFALIVGIFAAYVAGRALGPGAEYMAVFRFTGVTAFMCYSIALWQDYVWFRRSTGRTLKNTLDGIIYALLTAGAFGWLWPA